MTTTEEELRRILAPKPGATRDANGEWGSSEQDPGYLLSVAFHSHPDLLFEVASLAAFYLNQERVSLQSSVSTLLTLLAQASKLSPDPLPETLLDEIRGHGDLLAQVKTDDLATSPLYLQWLKKGEDLLKGVLNPSLTSSGVVTPPSESRKQALALVRALDSAVESIESRAALLRDAPSSFASAPILQKMREHVLKEVQRGISLQQERLAAGGALDGTEASVLLASRAAMGLVVSRTSSPRVYPSEGGVAAEPHSDAYPASPPRVDASPGPYWIPDTFNLTVTHDDLQEVLQLGPTGYPVLYGSSVETYTWGSDASGGSGPFTLAGETFEVFLQTSSGDYLDATVELPTGTLELSELIDALNQSWQALALDTQVLASESGGSLLVTAAGALAIGTESGASALGVSSTGGLTLTSEGYGYVRTSAGPFDLSTQATLLFSVAHLGTPVFVEVQLPLGGAVSAADVRDSISARLSTLGVSDWFGASLSGSMVDIGAATSDDALTIYPCSALAPLGLTAGASARGTYDSRTLDLLAGASSYTATLSAGTYSSPHLARLLQDALGSDLRVLATGTAGSKTLSFTYLGGDWQEVSFRSVQTGMALLLAIPNYASTSSATDASTLAAAIQRQSSLLRVSSVQTSPEEVIAERSPSGGLYLYETEGVAAASAPDPLTLQLVALSWEVSPGDALMLLSGPDSGSRWTVTSVDGETLLASGTITPTSTDVVRWVAGAPLGDRSGQSVRVAEGPLTGEHLISQTLYPLEVELLRSATQAGKGAATLSPLALRLEGTSPVPMRLEGDAAFAYITSTVIGPRLNRYTKPQTEWLRLEQGVEAVPGDYLEKIIYGAVADRYLLQETDAPLLRSTLRVDFDFTGHVAETSPLGLYYRVVSTRYDRLQTGRAELQAWLGGAPGRREVLIRAKRMLAQALQKKSPTPGQVAQAVLALEALSEEYVSLQPILEGIQGTAVGPRLDALLDTLEEEGMSGHIDVLRRADFATLFSDSLSTSPYRAPFDDLRTLMQGVARSMEEESEQQQLDYLDSDEEYDNPDEDNRAEVFDENG